MPFLKNITLNIHKLYIVEYKPCFLHNYVGWTGRRMHFRNLKKKRTSSARISALYGVLIKYQAPLLSWALCQFTLALLLLGSEETDQPPRNAVSYVIVITVRI